ncbi:chitotriosidase-1-like [Penaeus japonicus]|uniref:chitotriosidase-1-like n=1 Tax=Penaeus japonicus TaxID=27405 RepID=UPI001C714664|nr:chitotriosidase-1-like [Penaeus japonicus]
MVSPQSSWTYGALMLPFLLLLSTTPDTTSAAGDKVVCYYASWAHYRTGAAKYTVDDVPVELCTHVIYAFAVLDASSLVAREHDAYLDKAAGLDNYRRFVKLRERNPQAKMLLGLGGWTDSRSDKYSRLVSEPQRRAAFVSHVVSFLQEYGFDGLDLDWEYPGYQSSPQDKEGFRLWVEELRAAFSPRGLLLTAAVSAGKSVIDQGYDVPAVAKALDQIHLMSYDFHGSWERQVAHHAPLFPSPGQEKELSADFAVRHWIKRGAPASKLVLGVPFYGRSWTLAGDDASSGAPASGAGRPGPLLKDAGTMAYYEICQAHQRRGWTKVSGPGGPHLTHGDQWVGYDDVDAIRKKALYAQQKGLGGVMVWDVATDDFRGACSRGVNPLLSVVAKVLRASGPGTTARPPPTRPGTPRPVQATTLRPATPSRPTPTAPTLGGQVNKGECRATGFTADPSSCSAFYRCSGDSAYRYQCPGGLHWRQERLACDWPDAAARCRAAQR